MSLYETGVRQILDDYLLEESKKKRDYGNYWSASSAGYCMRKNIFERLGVPHIEEEDAARKQRVFTAGHVFHNWIQELTKASGASIAQEVELIDDKLMIKGHFDDLIKADDKLILYDYKTANSRSFNYKKEMSHYHRMQLGTYMYMLRHLKPGDKVSFEDGHLFMDKLGEFSSKGESWVTKIEEGRILVLEKDTLRTKEFVLEWSVGLEKDIYSYWSTLNGYWESKKMPKCTCADYEGGFLAKEAYNPYFYNGEPCSLDWYNHCKKTELIKVWSSVSTNPIR